MSSIARTKDQFAFVKLESLRGVLALPATADSVVLAESIATSQNPSYSDSPEIQNTRGVLERFADGLPAGEFPLKVLSRPTGVGSLPMGSPLFESLMGTKVQGASDVQYSQALTKPSFSICYRKGHMVYYCLGATSSEMSLEVSKKGAVTLEFKGKFMQRICMGDDALAATATAAASSIQVSDAKRFMVGGYVYNPACADNNGGPDLGAGTGYKITAINSVTNSLTLATNLAFAWAANEEVMGYLPQETALGTPILNKDTLVKINGVTGMIRSLSLNINDPCEYLEEEINGSPFPVEYVEGDRKITGSIKRYFRKTD